MTDINVLKRRLTKWLSDGFFLLLLFSFWHSALATLWDYHFLSANICRIANGFSDYKRIQMRVCFMHCIQSIEMTMSETRPLWSELLMMINLFAENCRDDFGVNVLWWHIKIYVYKFASNWMKLRDNRGIIGSIGQHFGGIVYPHTIHRIIIFCN